MGGASPHTTYTFDRFVIGTGNRFPYAALFAVAEAPAKAFNPVFVFGGAGLGKTHLLQAVGHYTAMPYPQLRCRYVTGEQLADEAIEAVATGGQAPVQGRYRDVDVLLLDDIQFLESMERAQEEFFHALDELRAADTQIVISADRPLPLLGHLGEEIGTRITQPEWGLITDIEPPDLETRRAIRREKSTHTPDQDGVRVPADVLELIAGRIQSNVRELEGALSQVIAHGRREHTEITVALAQRVLDELFPDAGDSGSASG